MIHHHHTAQDYKFPFQRHHAPPMKHPVILNCIMKFYSVLLFRYQLITVLVFMYEIENPTILQLKGHQQSKVTLATARAPPHPPVRYRLRLCVLFLFKSQTILLLAFPVFLNSRGHFMLLAYLTLEFGLLPSSSYSVSLPHNHHSAARSLVLCRPV